MAWISGPRQCGKTTFAKMLLGQRADGAYWNWDDIEFRRLWAKSPSVTLRYPQRSPGKRQMSRQRPLVIYDEIHKARGWKRTLKGIYDTLEHPADILVTGSARLNVYKKGGDSLLGRYFHFRLHPFSLGEIKQHQPQSLDSFLRALGDSVSPAQSQKHADALQQLLVFGGFPDPFLKQSERFARLWRRGRVEKLIREDLRDLSRLPELSRIEMLVSLLPQRVGSLLSIQSLREDLEVAHRTMQLWLNYLNELYYLFTLRPHSKSLSRAIKKGQKLYLWDWTEVAEAGPRFENLVACHLLKACDFWTDIGDGDFELRYARNKEKDEVDFIIVRDGEPALAIECKRSDTTVSQATVRLLRQLGAIPFIQLVEQPGVQRRLESQTQGACWIQSAGDVLSQLP